MAKEIKAPNWFEGEIYNKGEVWIIILKQISMV